jgi:hypothetical protein
VDDNRLVKGVAQCTGDNTESWQIRRPRPDSSRPEQATASTALRDLVAALGTSTISGKHSELVTFVPPLVDPDLCSAHVDVVVPLRKGTRRARLNIATLTVTAPPGDSRRGVSDQDKVQLTCEPPEPE